VNPQIRKLQANHAETYFALRLEGLTLEPFAFGRSAAEFRARSLESVRAQLIAPGSVTLGAFLDTQLVGIATLVRQDGEKTQHKADVYGVYVTPSARGQGIARTLLTRLIEHACSLGGLEQLRLSVSTTQQAARALYSSLGFVPFGHELRALKLGQQYVDEEHMVLHLHPIE
jgi:ribosomal protein S18 acetylase RimI-like enzyme